MEDVPRRNRPADAGEGPASDERDRASRGEEYNRERTARGDGPTDRPKPTTGGDTTGGHEPGGHEPGGSRAGGNDDPTVLAQLAGASAVGFEFIAAVLLPGALGYWLDGRFGTRPIVMIALGVFGFGVGLWRMLKTARPSSSES